MQGVTTVKEAVGFHGHLGPYLILGVKAGELALRKLKAKKYFGMQIKVWGAAEKPKSCLIDGLQLSTGATYGKGNICKVSPGGRIRVMVKAEGSCKKIEITLKKDLAKVLEALKSHKDSEDYARKLYRQDPEGLFDLRYRL
ncbi:MAG: formylmethanofuran dehydrogenase subunit E family protein [Candidatus Omnitrophota bacterium]